ncbi:MAG: 1,4-dihydroxy-6-naphthoate synthase [Bacteroidales bacterium]|nr:1,4-dihydroxy-6-naphthoate synthase [Bacteroidales bacterium]MDD3273341.1 1,4-dihydroxy-6-naphthoate synthase [Bacteroidales bacterium]MDD4058684.1 1,4-dihydroxy-6-naphthoate synthase [Bacteroidales bacterium]
MRLKLAYSPCPNDTFAFHAMVHNLVDCEGLEFDITLADVEQLNKGAQNREYDICKMSYHAFFLMTDKYVMLRSGSALGYHNGPLLVTRKGSKLSSANGEEISKALISSRIAIPGEMTTGALLLKIAFPEAKSTYPILFSKIADSIINGEFDAGVLIHEGRFTFKEKGLHLIMDLGENWHTVSSLPVPLGGIAVSRKIDSETASKIGRVLKRSIQFAMDNPEFSGEYVACHAQEMESSVQKKHIDLFVNNHTLEIGEEGERAVKELYLRLKEGENQINYRDELFIL